MRAPRLDFRVTLGALTDRFVFNRYASRPEVQLVLNCTPHGKFLPLETIRQLLLVWFNSIITSSPASLPPTRSHALYPSPLPQPRGAVAHSTYPRDCQTQNLLPLCYLAPSLIFLNDLPKSPTINHHSLALFD